MFNYTSCKLAAKYSKLKVGELWSQHYQVIKLPTKTLNTKTGRCIYNASTMYIEHHEDDPDEGLEDGEEQEKERMQGLRSTQSLLNHHQSQVVQKRLKFGQID